MAIKEFMVAIKEFMVAIKEFTVAIKEFTVKIITTHDHALKGVAIKRGGN